MILEIEFVTVFPAQGGILWECVLHAASADIRSAAPIRFGDALVERLRFISNPSDAERVAERMRGFERLARRRDTRLNEQVINGLRARAERVGDEAMEEMLNVMADWVTETEDPFSNIISLIRDIRCLSVVD